MGRDGAPALSARRSAAQRDMYLGRICPIFRPLNAGGDAAGAASLPKDCVLCKARGERENFPASGKGAWLFYFAYLTEDSVAGPNHPSGHEFVREQAKFCGGFGLRFAGNIKHAGNAEAAVGDGDGQVADFIDEAGAEHGAVECAAALKHESAEVEGMSEFVEGNFQIDFFFAAK